MDFDLEKDISIFDALISKRPEISPENLKKDLQKYYLPYVQKLIDLKKQKNSDQALIVGVSAIQGAGKTTQGEILEILLKHFGYTCVSRSIDDHYITHAQLCELRHVDSRFIRRGVTHDIPLAMRELSALKMMQDGHPVLLSGYDKGAHYGDGDRFQWVSLSEDIILKAKVIESQVVVDKKLQVVPVLDLQKIFWKDQSLEIPENMGVPIPLAENIVSGKLIQYLYTELDQEVTIILTDEGKIFFRGSGEISVAANEVPKGWKVITKRPDFIFYDGWMLGARKVVDESIFDSGLPALETEDAKNFAKEVNKKLTDYEPLWSMFDFLNVLYVLNYKISLAWRDQAEESLRKEGEGMSHEQIQEFVYYFWRSVHPAIHIKNLAYDMEHTNQVVIINDDHTVGEVLIPEQLKEKYPQ